MAYILTKEFNDMFFGVGKFYYKPARKFERMWTEDRPLYFGTKQSAVRALKRLNDPDVKLEEA